MNWIARLTVSMVFLFLSSQYGNTAARVYLSPSIVSAEALRRLEARLPPALGPSGLLLNPSTAVEAAASLSEPVEQTLNLLSDHRHIEPHISPFASAAAQVLSESGPEPSGLFKPAAELYESYLSSSASQVAAARGQLKSEAQLYVPLGPSESLVLPVVRSYEPYIKPEFRPEYKPPTLWKPTSNFDKPSALLDLIARPYGSIESAHSPHGPYNSGHMPPGAVVPVSEEPLPRLVAAALAAHSHAVPRFALPVTSRLSIPVDSFLAQLLAVQAKPFGPPWPVVSAPEYLEPQSKLAASPSLAVPRFVLPVASRQSTPNDSPFAQMLPVQAKHFVAARPVVSASEYFEPHSRLDSKALASPSPAVPRFVLPVTSRLSLPVDSFLTQLLPVQAKPFGPPGQVESAPEYLEPQSKLAASLLASSSPAVPRFVLPVTSRLSIPVDYPLEQPLPVQAKPFGPPGPVASAPEHLEPHSKLAAAALAARSLTAPGTVLPLASRQLVPVVYSFAPLLTAEARPFGPNRPLMPADMPAVVSAPDYLDPYSRLRKGL